jgi:hypothetical protein
MSDSLMILPVERRRHFWRQAYMIELAKDHAAGKMRWPIEQLGEITDKAIDAYATGTACLGDAAKRTAKFLKIKPTLKSIREFLN